MSDSELKITLFRWIDSLSGDRLHKLFKVVEDNMDQSFSPASESIKSLEEGYAAMASDSEREKEANEWVESLLYTPEL